MQQHIDPEKAFENEHLELNQKRLDLLCEGLPQNHDSRTDKFNKINSRADEVENDDNVLMTKQTSQTYAIETRPTPLSSLKVDKLKSAKRQLKYDDDQEDDIVYDDD